MSKFKQAMLDIKNYEGVSDIDYHADKLLTECLYLATVKLEEARANGRGGWWNEEECTLEYLKYLRFKSILEKDHLSTVNFTMMIALRESVEQ